MSERKYKQRGYQDDPRERRPMLARKPLEPHDPRIPRDPKAPSMPGFRQAFRCGRCGHLEPAGVVLDSRCSNCGVDLHACVHCTSFDSATRFECRENIPARVSPKDGRNSCTLFAPRLSVERETGSTPASGGTSSAKKAFDDLFKF